MGSSPKAPDPLATANTQQAMNTQTAVTQAGLNNVDQVTPYGNLTYDKTTWADGSPKFTATTSLTPEQQNIFGINQQTQANIAGIGRDQSARIGTLLGSPLKLGNEATEGRLMELGMSRLTPQFARDEQALRSQLFNAGIREGSAAWDSEMGRLDRSKTDAITQLLLQGRSQANQELLTERNQPINEIASLLSGSQVSMPNFQNTPTTNIAPTDYSSLVQSNYAQQSANQNAMMGGLFSLAGAGVTGGLSLMRPSNTFRLG